MTPKELGEACADAIEAFNNNEKALFEEAAAIAASLSSSPVEFLNRSMQIMFVNGFFLGRGFTLEEIADDNLGIRAIKHAEVIIEKRDN